MKPLLHSSISSKVLFSFKEVRALLLLFLLIAFCAGTAQAQSWYNASWSYRKAITIDASKVGTGPHTNFPVLINRADADLQVRAQADADDILFTSSDGTTKLSHEIESYTSASGTLVAWVKIPSLSSSANTTIYMYYGNAAATSQQNRTGTWDASFRGVYHLNNAFADATSNAYNGTNVGTLNTTGKISNGRGFVRADGNDYVSISGLMGSSANLTLSAWASSNSKDAFGAQVLNIGDNVGLNTDETTRGAYGFAYFNSTWNQTQSGTQLAGSGWRYLTYTFDDVGNVQRFYIDGVLTATTNHTPSINYLALGPNTFIGGHSNGNRDFDFDGNIDEVRVASSPRSAGWVLTEYNNQNSPSTFYSVGSQSCNSPSAPIVVSPINYCQNATAAQLTATGTGLSWGSGGITSGTAGGTATLGTTTFIDGQYGPSTNYTAFTTLAPNVTITSINYSIPAWQGVTGLRLSLYTSSGTLLANSTTVTTYSNGGTAFTVTNTFNYTIAAAGDYTIKASAGYGNVGGDQPTYPITEGTGTINVTGHNSGGYRCFNNIQFTVGSSTATAPTPSTTTIGTTNYSVTQTVNGCTSAPATITVNVNAAPSLTQIPASGLSMQYNFAGNATDASGLGNHGTLVGAPTALADRNGNASAAYSFNGSSQYVTTTTSYVNPVNLTYVIWFRTTTSTGGKLIGFGSNQTGLDGAYDRHVYMSNSGQLYFGVYPNTVKTINTQDSYNDGAWHQVVASLSSTNGMKLYVDGNLKASDPTTLSAQNYTGWMKLAYGNMNGWINVPSSFYFNGTLDDVLVYGRELTASEIATLYTGLSGAGSNAPICPGQTLNLTAAAITNATYSWTGPNGFTSNVQNPTISNVTSAHAGTYSVTATVSGCTSSAVNVVVSLRSAPSATIAYNSGAALCQSAISQAVTHTGTTGGTYSSTAGLTINASTGVINPNTSTAGTYTVTYTMVGAECTQTATTSVTIATAPSVSGTSTATCVGGSTGTITASGSGGQAPLTYSLNAGTYQSSTTFTGLAAGTYTLNVRSNTGCIASTTVVVSPFATATDNQNAAGTNTWTAHVYDGINFDNYVGQYAQTETFNEQFGGATVCLPLTSNGVARSIYTETFSVKYRMASTKSGLYIADLGSDDGSRLTVDNTLVYNNWSLQAFTSKPRVLMPLTGSSSLLYEYYENGGGNEVAFQNLTLVLANTLSVNTAQNICIGGIGTAISGDTYGALPTGISLSGTGYQWSYSTTPGGTRIDIAGATDAAFTPSASAAPFNTPGTYYIFRKAILTSINNISPNPYVATHESNAATILVATPPSATISYSGSPYCSPAGTASVTRTGTGGGTYSSTAGLSINASTGEVNLSASIAGTYTVTYTIAASGGCSEYTATTTIQISPIRNNQLNYVNGLNGVLCATPNENGTAILTAPAGTIFTTVDFASYGAPGGTCSSFTLGGCHAATSQSVSETYLLGNNAANIPATNAVFSDPCVGTPKRFYVQATYTQPICSGTSPGVITGTTPTGGNGSYTYLWERSTTSASTGFAVAPGTNNTKDYTPGVLTQTTWFRRTVTSNGCSDTKVIQVSVSPALSATISYSGSPFCANAGTASVTQTGTSGGTYSSTAGLSINTSTGAVNLGASTPGTYTVTYTIPASGTCGVYTTTTTISITAAPFATGTYTASPYCSNGGIAYPSGAASGTGVFTAPAGLSINATTGAVNLGASTPGTYTVTFTIAASGGCSEYVKTTDITITAAPSASISYAASPYVVNGGTATVTRTGTAGGSYSSTAGLTINAASGAVDLSTSTPGTYTVTYSIPAANGCSIYTTTTSITINSGTKTWDGGAGTIYWGDAANWDTDGVPTSADNVDLTGAHTINVNVAATTKNILLNNAGLVVTVSSGHSLTVSGNLTLTNGTLNTETAFPTVSGTINVSGGTIGFTGSGSQTIPAYNYNNLTSSSTGARVLANSGTIGIAGSFTPGTNAYTITGSTINYNAAGAQNIALFNYHNLVLGNSGVKTLNAGTTGVSGALSIAGTASANTTANAATISYNGSTDQTITPLTYYGLDISSTGGTVTAINTIVTNFSINSGTLDLNSSTLTTTGTAIFTSGSINNGAVAASGTSITFAGTAFGAIVTASSGLLYLNGSTFNNTASLTKTGSVTTISTGGNTFNGITTITNNSSGSLDLANNLPDIFNTHVTFNNTSTSRIQIGISSIGNLFNGNVTINHGGSGASLNTLIARNSGSTATINGNLVLNCTNGNTSSGIIIANDGHVNINGNVTVASSSGRGVLFGAASGTVLLSSGYTIKEAGPGSFTTGTLTLRGLTQLGNTPQTITLDGTANLTIGTLSEFNGAVNFSAPQLFVNSTTFNGISSLAKTGATDNTSTGGNIFNSAAVITNSGTGFLRLGNASADDFNSDATFIQTGSGLLQPSYNTITGIAGNFSTEGTAAAISFGGTVALNGTGAQSILGTFTPAFSNLTVSNTGSTVSSAVNVSVAGNLSVTSGTFNLGRFTANRLTSGGTLTVASGAALKIGGGNTIPSNYSTHSVGATSTIEYSGINQTVASLNSAQNYGHLTISGTGTQINTNNITVRNNLTVSGSLNINTYHLKVGGSISSSGAFDAFNGSIELNGTLAQSIPANCFSTNTIKGLTINNTAGVSLGGTLNLTDVLTVSAGSLASNGHLVLKSSATATARVAPITSVAATPIIGNVVAERYVPGRRKYRLITSPVTTSTKTTLSAGEEALSMWAHWQNGGVNTTPNAGNLITGGSAADGFDTQTTSASLFTYDDVNRKYVAFSSANGKKTKYTPLKAGIAYYMFVYGDRRNTVFASNPNNTILSATGNLKTGDQVYTANSEIPLTNVVGRFTLLGNPYASPIDWATMPRTDIANAMWGWDPNLASTGGYVTVTTNGTVTLTAPYSGSVGLDQYIQSGQGFYVKTTGAAPSLTIREQDKVGNFNASAFRTFGRKATASASRLANDIPLIAINLQYETAGTKVLADGVLAAFDATFANGVGEEDATKMANSAEALSILNGNELLSIDGRKLPTVKDTLHLNTVKLTKAQYTLQVFTKKVGGDMQVFLEDSYRNTSQQLVLNDTNTIVFNVSASEPLSSAANRFKVVFAPTVALPVKFVSVKAAEKNSGVQVEWSVGEQTEVKHYEVEHSSDGVQFTKAGEVPARKNGSTETYQWLHVKPTGGSNYYRVRAIEEDGQNFLSRVVVVNRAEGKAAIKVSPNPVQGGRINLQLMHLEKGRYTLQLISAQGQLISAEILEHEGGSSARVLYPRKLAAGVYYLKLKNEATSYEQKIFVE